jgi:hypothetical protein
MDFRPSAEGYVLSSRPSPLTTGSVGRSVGNAVENGTRAVNSFVSGGAQVLKGKMIGLFLT